MGRCYKCGQATIGSMCPFCEVKELEERDKMRKDEKPLIATTENLFEHKTLEEVEKEGHDAVNHPSHYTSHPSGIECIQITEHMGFNLGNALKYVWRADLKGNATQDMEKAIWYINRELEKRNDGK